MLSTGIIAAALEWLMIFPFWSLAALAMHTHIGIQEYSRHDFPPGFVFGAGTSAYQAFKHFRLGVLRKSLRSTRKGWRGPHLRMEGHLAFLILLLMLEDVKLMVETGLEGYRFSISWPRLIPNGRGPINQKALQYYNHLINELLSNGIQPHVTLVHMDVPQALQDEYGAWLSTRIVNDMTTYAEVCFREFGDRVKHWTTINEPNAIAMLGYDVGFLPPARCSPPFGFNCSAGNSCTEPYIVAHHILLSHASVAQLYRTKYQATQQGFIGFNLFAYHFVPLTNKLADIIATRRVNDFYLGWFMEPLLYGEYPTIVKRQVDKRLPQWKGHESKLVKGSFDFIGVNHYTIMLVKDANSTIEPRDFFLDIAAQLLEYNRTEDTPSDGFPYLPWGLQGVLEQFKQVYGNPPIYIHENGQRTARNASLHDISRVKYLKGYIGSLLDAARNGSNVRGYFTWSFMDVFELLDGYKSAYGLYYVDLDDQNLTRYPKSSQRWYSSFLKGEPVTIKDRLICNTHSLTSNIFEEFFVSR